MVCRTYYLSEGIILALRLVSAFPIQTVSNYSEVIKKFLHECMVIVNED